MNDYCANWKGVDLCYGGGCGFGTWLHITIQLTHTSVGAGAYGKTGWARRARVIELSQDPTTKQGMINTWKRLDYYMGGLAMKDHEQIFPEPPYPDHQQCSACVNASRVWYVS